jgi:hypothetical protein
MFNVSFAQAATRTLEHSLELHPLCPWKRLPLSSCRVRYHPKQHSQPIPGFPRPSHQLDRPTVALCPPLQRTFAHLQLRRCSLPRRRPQSSVNALAPYQYHRRLPLPSEALRRRIPGLSRRTYRYRACQSLKCHRASINGTLNTVIKTSSFRLHSIGNTGVTIYKTFELFLLTVPPRSFLASHLSSLLHQSPSLKVFLPNLASHYGYYLVQLLLQWYLKFPAGCDLTHTHGRTTHEGDENWFLRESLPPCQTRHLLRYPVYMDLRLNLDVVVHLLVVLWLCLGCFYCC